MKKPNALLKRYKMAKGGTPKTGDPLTDAAAAKADALQNFLGETAIGLLDNTLDPADEFGTRSGAGAAVSGAMKGAMAGKAAGLPGIAIGTVVGGLTSFLGNKKAQKEKQRILTENAEEAEDAATAATDARIAADPTLLYGKTSSMYKLGGTVKGEPARKFNPGKIVVPVAGRIFRKPTIAVAPNKMAEGGLVRTSTTTAEVEGPKHENGGVKFPEIGVELEGGETVSGDFVFSEELGFADIHKKIGKSLGKTEKRPYTPLNANTEKALKRKEGFLKIAQEETKRSIGLDNEIDNTITEIKTAQKTGDVVMKKGGKLSSAYLKKATGGNIDPDKPKQGRPIDQFDKKSITRTGTIAYPSDSTYFKNPFPEAATPIAARTQTGSTTYENPNLAYKETYNNTYREFMNQTSDSGKKIVNPVASKNVFPFVPRTNTPIQTPARTRAVEDAKKAYLKDVDGIELFNSEDVIKAAKKGKVSSTDTVGMTLADRYNVEKGFAAIKPKKMREGGDINDDKPKMYKFWSQEKRNEYDSKQKITTEKFKDNMAKMDKDMRAKGIIKSAYTPTLPVSAPVLPKSSKAPRTGSTPRTATKNTTSARDTENIPTRIKFPENVINPDEVLELPPIIQGKVSQEINVTPGTPKPKTEITGTKTPTSKTQEEEEIGRNKILDAADSMAPFASNIVNSFTKLPAPPKPTMDPTLTPTLVDYSADRTEATRQRRGADKTAAASSNSAANAGATKAANLTQQIRATNQINENENNVNSQIKNQFQSINANITRSNNLKKDYFNQQQVERTIKQQELASQNMADVGNKMQAIKRDKATQQLEEDKMLLTIFSDETGATIRAGKEILKRRLSPEGYKEIMELEKRLSKANAEDREALRKYGQSVINSTKVDTETILADAKAKADKEKSEINKAKANKLSTGYLKKKD